MTNTTPQPVNTAIEVVHATPGRVRIKARNHKETVAQHLRQIEGVYSVILHSDTDSLVLKFDTRKLSLSQLLAQLTVSHRALENQLEHQRVSGEQTVTSIQNSQPSTEVIETLIRMSAAMLLNRHLGISGWVSLPVSYATSQATAKVINGVKPQLKNAALLTANLTAINSNNIPEKKLEISVIHSTPGRIRLRVPQVKEDSRYAKRLERFAEQISGIQTININPTTASVTIIHQFNSIVKLESELNRLFEKVAESQPNLSEILTAPVTTSEIQLAPSVEEAKAETRVENVVEKSVKPTVDKPIQTVSETVVNTTPKLPEKKGVFSDFKSSMLSMFLNFMAGRPAPQTVG
ncbi:HMA2 domain-containing protein [Capilliphycus salinus ALCB114379]|uniref:HMA2 domain-containing protein n=1 Tax=Capilliphycus salinus TaxID=2768948 RepID=UPI0039A3FE71